MKGALFGATRTVLKRDGVLGRGLRGPARTRSSLAIPAIKDACQIQFSSLPTSALRARSPSNLSLNEILPKRAGVAASGGAKETAPQSAARKSL